MKLHSFLLGTASSMVLAASASAADLPLKAAAPAALPASNWTGFYIGVHGGVARSNYSVNIDRDAYLTHTDGATGGVFGGQIGYNWQNRYWVYGVEADGSWTGLDRSYVGVGSQAYGKTEWLASLRGRMGVALDDSLIYVTGGLALGHSGWGFAYTGDPLLANDKTRVGWVAGVGVEHMLGRNYSVRGEILYYDLGRASGSYGTQSGTFTSAFTNQVTVGRVGLNWRW